MVKKYTLELKMKVVALRKEGYTFQEIFSKTSIPACTACKICKKYKKNGTLNRIRGSIRPRLLNKGDVSILTNEISTGPRTSSKKLAKVLKEKTNKYVSPKIVIRSLK